MPPGWTEVALGDVCEIVSGATPKTGVPEYWGGEVPWATPKDLSDLNEKYISDTPRQLTADGLRSCSARVLPPGSVLLSSRAPIGLLAINTVAMATNQGFKSLIPAADRLDQSFLYWWLKVNRRYLDSLGRGATFKEISKAVTAEIRIPLPPIEEQRRIAAALDHADELRAKRRAALALLDTLTESIFLDVLADAVANANGQKRLDQVADIQVGYPFSSDLYTDGGEGIRLCRGANVLPGRICWDEERRYPSSDAAGLQNYALKEGDVVLAMDRPWIAGGLKVAAVDAESAGSLLVQRVARVRPRGVPGEYILRLLRHRSFTVHCRPTETTIPHISPLEVRSFLVPVPTPEPLEEFEQRMATVRPLRTQAMRSRLHGDDLFASLQQRAFRGEL